MGSKTDFVNKEPARCPTCGAVIVSQFVKQNGGSWTCILCQTTHSTALKSNGQDDDLLFMTKDFDPAMKSKSKAIVCDLDISGSMMSGQQDV